MLWLHFCVDWQNSFSAPSHQATEAHFLSPEINTWQMTNIIDTCMLSVLLPAIIHNNDCVLRLRISVYKNVSWLLIVLSAVWNCDLSSYTVIQVAYRLPKTVKPTSVYNFYLQSILHCILSSWTMYSVSEWLIHYFGLYKYWDVHYAI